MAETKYRIEPAKTGRSTCKFSKEKIEQGELRLGSLADMMGHATYQWRRLSSITTRIARNIEAKVGTLENVDGFHDLTPAQQKEFREAMAVAKSGTRTEAMQANAKAKTSSKGATAKPCLKTEMTETGTSEALLEMLPFLTRLGIPEQPALSYSKLLEEQGFDCMTALLTLRDQDLERFGVLMGHRRLIMRYVSAAQSEIDSGGKREGDFAMEHPAATAKVASGSGPSFVQRSAAARRWKRRQETQPEAAKLASKFIRSRSRRLADEMGLELEEARTILQENDEAVAAASTEGHQE